MTSIHHMSQATTPSAQRRRVRAAAVDGAVLATSLLGLIARMVGVGLRVDQHNGQGSQVIGLPLIVGFTLSVLLLSFAPILLAGATIGSKTTLSLIHLTVAAILIPTLQRGSSKGRGTTT